MLVLSTIVLSSVQYTPHMGEPPLEILTRPVPEYVLGFREHDLVGRACFSVSKKEITVTWSKASASHQDPRAYCFQTFSSSFWPTAITSWGDTLVVAGKHLDGNTVIEEWRIEEPELIEAPPRQVGDPPRPDFSIRPTKVATKTTLYDGAVEGKDMVTAIVPLLADTNKLVVKFWDSGDLYSLTRDGRETMVLLAGPGPRCPVSDARLANVYDSFSCADNILHGHVYFLIDRRNRYRLGLNRTLVLFDSNRDGVIERVAIPSDEEYLSEFAGRDKYRFE